jgi:hypothetical protein
LQKRQKFLEENEDEFKKYEKRQKDQYDVDYDKGKLKKERKNRKKPGKERDLKAFLDKIGKKPKLNSH